MGLFSKHSDSNSGEVKPRRNLVSMITSNVLGVSAASVIDRAMFHPLDNIITMQQTQNISFPSAVKTSVKNKLLYTGFGFSFISSIPVRLATYSTYFVAQDVMKHDFRMPRDVASLYAACLSGLSEAAVLYPSDLRRTRSLANVVNTISMKEHSRLFTPLALRLVLENGVALIGAEKLQESMTASTGSPSIFWQYSAGLISGMGSQVISAPFDMLKSHKMASSKPEPLSKSISKLFREGAFFRALPLKMARAGLCNSVVFGTTAYIAPKLYM